MFGIAYKKGTGRAIAYPSFFDTREAAQTTLDTLIIKDSLHVVETDGEIKVEYGQ